MTSFPILEEGIFKDRRSAANATVIKPVVCRRDNAFSKADSRPWWLKVDYVNADHSAAAANFGQRGPQR